MAGWIEPGLTWRVEISTEGPLDEPGSGDIFDVTPHVRNNELTVRRGRNDERDHFQAGHCNFTLRNNDRSFDPTRTRVCLDLPGTVGDTATTPDLPPFSIGGDLEVWVELSMDDWIPGGLGSLVVGQWPNVAGNNGWLLGVNLSGHPVFVYTTDGTTQNTRTSVSVTGWDDGSVHWLGATVDLDNGAGGHTVTFWTRDVDGQPVQLGDPVVTAGTISAIFDSTGPLQFGGVLPFAGQVYRAELRDGIGGAPVARPDFTVQTVGVSSFVDRDGATWSINGAAEVTYDRHSSPYAAILRPMRRVQVIFTVDDVDYVKFTGYLDGWPQTWTKVTGSVDLTATDITTLLSQIELVDVGFTLDDDVLGLLDENLLSGDVPEQYPGQRVESLVAMSGWAGDTDISVGKALMPAIVGDPDADEPLTGDLISLIHDAETAEAGFFFVAGDGTAVFRDRHSRIELPRMAEIQATLTDCEYRDLLADQSLTQVRNDVTYSRPGGPPQIAVSDSSIALYGHWSQTDTLQVVADGEAMTRAQFDVWRFGHPKVRPSPVTFYPRRDMATLAPVAAGLELLDRVAIERTPAGDGLPMRWVGLIDSVEDRLTADDWAVTVAVSLVDVDSEDDYLILDDDVRGQLDSYDLIY